ncbi:Hypothetical predicted protein [Octopus vulgaris]|uniref:Uncharacterized protein n=1 Tax=Octopus vulgaris TaxID=6645 RepID=A0AA36F624_OCTVU|nr:Hypothetical predicted protein [Octopus vulgaris]
MLEHHLQLKKSALGLILCKPDMGFHKPKLSVKKKDKIKEENLRGCKHSSIGCQAMLGEQTQTHKHTPTHIYIYIYIYIYLHKYDELLSVSIYQIHSQGFGRPKAIVEYTCPRCHAVGLNPEPCGW